MNDFMDVYLHSLSPLLLLLCLEKGSKCLKNNIKSTNIKNKVLYCSDNRILLSLNNTLVTKRGSFHDEVVSKKADFFRVLNIKISCCTKDGFDLNSGLTDKNDIDFDNPNSDDVFV